MLTLGRVEAQEAHRGADDALTDVREVQAGVVVDFAQRLEVDVPSVQLVHHLDRGED